MQPLETTPITQKDLKQYLAVTSDDFRLELEAFNVCKSSGLMASHGATYEDPITKKTRQYDVRASQTKDQRTVQLAIECKHLKPFFPLLVLQTPRSTDESYIEIVWSHRPADPITSGQVPVGTHRNDDRKFYPVDEFVGKVTRRIGKHKHTKEFVDDDSEVFDKWSQAVSSAHDLIDKSAEGPIGKLEPFFYTITLPVLVLSDRTLWIANYTEDGVQKGLPKRTDQTTVYIGKQFRTSGSGIRYCISHLHVFTLTGFKQFIQRLVMNGPNEYIWYHLFPHKWISEHRNAKN